MRLQRRFVLDSCTGGAELRGRNRSKSFHVALLFGLLVVATACTPPTLFGTTPDATTTSAAIPITVTHDCSRDVTADLNAVLTNAPTNSVV